MIPTKTKVSWTTYAYPIYIALGFVTLVIFLESRRSIGGYFNGLKGGTEAGPALAYFGSLLLVSAQFYTIVKRSAWIGFIKRV